MFADALHQTPDKARKVLNTARKAVPTSHEIWIAAGRLLEQEATREPTEKEKEEGKAKSPEQREKELLAVDKTIETGVRELRKHQVLLTREQWLKEAERCEDEGSLRVCEAIVKATVGMEVEEEDRYETWVADVQSCLDRGKIGTARAILAYALRVFPDRKDLWRMAADLEKTHGTRASLDKVLEEATRCVPPAEVLWLMRAKERWVGGDVGGAREVLVKAFDTNPESEAIWLAAVKLEAENGELGVARELLGRARAVAGTQRVSSFFLFFALDVSQLTTDVYRFG